MRLIIKTYCELKTYQNDGSANFISAKNNRNQIKFSNILLVSLSHSIYPLFLLLTKNIMQSLYQGQIKSIATNLYICLGRCSCFITVLKSRSQISFEFDLKTYLTCCQCFFKSTFTNDCIYKTWKFSFIDRLMTSNNYQAISRKPALVLTNEKLAFLALLNWDCLAETCIYKMVSMNNA